jgi:hypothetical protein
VSLSAGDLTYNLHRSELSRRDSNVLKPTT